MYKNRRNVVYYPKRLIRTIYTGPAFSERKKVLYNG